MGSLRYWHRWIGLVAALVLTVAAASGALLVYKKPLVRWLVTPGAELPANYGPAQMMPELDRLGGVLPREGRELIKAPNGEEPYWTLTDGAGHVRLLRIGDLAPYGDELHVLDLFAFVRHLHTELLAGAVGEWIYLAAGLLCLVLSVTGLILWWPTRRLFRWRWVWPRPFRASLLLQYHRHSGALAVPVLLLVVLTGCVMLWQKLVAPLLPPVPVTRAVVDGEAGSSPAALLSLALAQIPDGWPTYIRLPSAAGGEASFRFQLPGEWHPNGRTSVGVDTVTGEMTVSRRSDEVSAGRRLLNQMYPLHSGYGLHVVYTLLILLAGVSLLWLSVSGFVSYFRRRGRSPAAAGNRRAVEGGP